MSCVIALTNGHKRELTTSLILYRNRLRIGETSFLEGHSRRTNSSLQSMRIACGTSNSPSDTLQSNSKPSYNLCGREGTLFKRLGSLSALNAKSRRKKGVEKGVTFPILPMESMKMSQLPYT